MAAAFTHKHEIHSSSCDSMQRMHSIPVLVPAAVFQKRRHANGLCRTDRRRLLSDLQQPLREQALREELLRSHILQIIMSTFTISTNSDCSVFTNCLSQQPSQTRHSTFSVLLARRFVAVGRLYSIIQLLC